MITITLVVIAGSVSAATGTPFSGRNTSLTGSYPAANSSKPDDPQELEREQASAADSGPAGAPDQSAQPSQGSGSGQPSPSLSTSVPQTGKPLSRLGTDDVALTFDDGPDDSTSAILDLLQQYNVKATFCVIGTSVSTHHDVVRRIVAEGHTLCNHTWSHTLTLGEQSADEIRADLQRTIDEIHRAVPDAPVEYFRHPGGNFTETAIAVASELGMTSISWNVDPADWNVKKYGTGQTMAQHVIDAVTEATKPGAIVLSHDGGGDRSGTVCAYATLLPWLSERYSLIPLPTQTR